LPRRTDDRRCARPEALSENRRDNFFPKIEIRARVNRQRVRRLSPGGSSCGRGRAEIGEEAIPARSTDNPLIFLETAKEKVWKSLEKFGISLEFPWKSLEILGKAWKSLSPRRQDTQPLSKPASAGERGPRGEAEENRLASR
jgi:hypothetical protein